MLSKLRSKFYLQKKCFFPQDNNPVRLKLFMWKSASVFSKTSNETKKKILQRRRLCHSYWSVNIQKDRRDIYNVQIKIELTTTKSICHVFFFAILINCSGGKTNIFLMEKWFFCYEEKYYIIYYVQSEK